MALIHHRVNKISEVLKLPAGRGAEIDLRSSVDSLGKLHLSHDPWIKGDDFEEWLKVFASQPRETLILNTKEDGLENRVLELLEKCQVKNYFFLDTAMPTLVKHTNQLKNPNFAVRFSQWEPEGLCAKFEGLASWLWVDCFGGDLRLPSEALQKKFKICLVSPELQGASQELIGKYKSQFQGKGFSVCTKFPELWTNL